MTAVTKPKHRRPLPSPEKTHCDNCGLPPAHKQNRPLKPHGDEMWCDVCLKEEERAREQAAERD